MPLPWTPDFDVWPVTHRIAEAVAEGESVRVRWDDGLECRFHAVLLRENSPDEQTIHPLSRESLISPVDLPADLTARSARVDDSGALEVEWSSGGQVSRYHPGWLRANGWFGDSEEENTRVLWSSEEQPQPPTFNGPAALAEPQTFLAWLEALRDYGVARLSGLPIEDGLLETIVSKIGSIRETNFGRMFIVAVKDDPDSNAYTSHALPQHIDLPTRECPPGLQFLYCRANTTTGGEGTYADSYRIAEDMRREEPAHFESLVGDSWLYNNRAKNTDYRAAGPVVELDSRGHVCAVRYNTWLRAPLKAPLETQARAYAAYRAFAARAQSPHYQMVLTYRPGDLVVFDNRRALHGRKGYDAKGGERYMEGMYSDRDELYSRIRIIKRQLRETKP